MINNIWILIYKKLNDLATPEELEELDHYLENDNSGTYQFELLEHIWKNSFKGPVIHCEASETGWASLSAKINADINTPEPEPAGHFRAGRLKKIYRYTATAAAFLVLSAGTLCLLLRPGAGKNEITRISAPKGAITNIELPDGSKVTLNSGSRISFENSFSSGRRELFLSGEAFFEVVKDARHPFVVTTSAMKIKVLGTRFNVRAYQNENTAEASLIKGSIELTVLQNPDRQIVLKPAEKLTLIKKTDRSKKLPDHGIDGIESVRLSLLQHVNRDSLPPEVMWMENKIVFENLAFCEISRMMERKFDVSFHFSDEKLAGLRFTGRFDNISLTEALRQLQLITNFKYTINQDQVTIHY